MKKDKITDIYARELIGPRQAKQSSVPSGSDPESTRPDRDGLSRFLPGPVIVVEQVEHDAPTGGFSSQLAQRRPWPVSTLL